MQRILLTTFGLLAIVAAASVATAEIYRVIDADGNISFTDKPPADASNVSSEPVNVDASTQNTSLSGDAIKEDQPEWLREAQQKRASKRRPNAPANPARHSLKPGRNRCAMPSNVCKRRAKRAKRASLQPRAILLARRAAVCAPLNGILKNCAHSSRMYWMRSRASMQSSGPARVEHRAQQ